MPGFADLNNMYMSTTENNILSTAQIAEQFFALVSQGSFEEAQNIYFSPEIISIEIPDADGYRKKDQSLPAIAAKREAFQAIVASVESLKTGQLIIHGNSFAFAFELDFTVKNGGPQRLAEICVYQVEGGKIVTEQFFN
jgi:hypothetical protein